MCAARKFAEREKVLDNFREAEADLNEFERGFFEEVNVIRA